MNQPSSRTNASDTQSAEPVPHADEAKGLPVGDRHEAETLAGRLEGDEHPEATIGVPAEQRPPRD
jgi:hypothetical protein